MTKQITAADLIREVRAVASERPDFVYAEQEGYSPTTGCSYLGAAIGNADGEGCIMGQALGRLEFDMEALGAWEEDRTGKPGGGTGVRSLLERFGIPAERNESGWLGLVLGKQDHGGSWSEAVAVADELHPIHA